MMTLPPSYVPQQTNPVEVLIAIDDFEFILRKAYVTSGKSIRDWARLLKITYQTFHDIVVSKKDYRISTMKKILIAMSEKFDLSGPPSELRFPLLWPSD